MSDYEHFCFNDVNREYWAYEPTGEMACGVCGTVLYGVGEA